MKLVVKLISLALMASTLQGCYIVASGPLYPAPFYRVPRCMPGHVPTRICDVYGCRIVPMPSPCAYTVATQEKSAEELAADYGMTLKTAEMVKEINARLSRGDKSVLTEMGVSNEALRAIAAYIEGSSAELALSDETVNQVAGFVNYEAAHTRRFLSEVLATLRQRLENNSI